MRTWYEVTGVTRNFRLAKYLTSRHVRTAHALHSSGVTLSLMVFFHWI